MEYIKYMKSRASLMTIVPAAGVLPGQPVAQSEPLFVARPCEDALARLEDPGLPKSAESLYQSNASWLAVEDEYFPFDADLSLIHI